MRVLALLIAFAGVVVVALAVSGIGSLVQGSEIDTARNAVEMHQALTYLIPQGTLVGDAVRAVNSHGFACGSPEHGSWLAWPSPESPRHEIANIDLVRCTRDDPGVAGTWHWEVGFHLDGERVRAIYVNGN